MSETLRPKVIAGREEPGGRRAPAFRHRRAARSSAMLSEIQR